MIYGNLLAKLRAGPAVKVGIIGAGNFATATITQCTAIPDCEVTFIADAKLDASENACTRAGWDRRHFEAVASEADLRRVRKEGRIAITTSPALMAACDMDVMVEATGDAEAGARHALMAIGLGRHVVMVNKETDSVVGPILARRARAAGVVYTQADGDQPALMVALWDWARLLGLEVVAAGKSHDRELVLDRGAGRVTVGQERFPVEAGWIEALDSARGDVAKKIALRRALFQDRIAVANYDRLEMVSVANGTGLAPLTGPCAEPILRTREIPEALCLEVEGGILRNPGVLDTVCSLLEPDIPTLGGGVFVVVHCANEYSRRILTGKGLLANRAGTAAMIYRPHHLCGVETPISILSAARLGVPTGARDVRLLWDVVAVARRDLAAGTILGGNLEFSDQLGSRYETHRLTRQQGLLPLGMSAGLRLTCAVPAGATLSQEVVEIRRDSLLWQLREEQEAEFADQS